jgi:hypothetical protein
MGIRTLHEGESRHWHRVVFGMPIKLFSSDDDKGRRTVRVTS